MNNSQVSKLNSTFINISYYKDIIYYLCMYNSQTGDFPLMFPYVYDVFKMFFVPFYSKTTSQNTNYENELFQIGLFKT